MPDEPRRRVKPVVWVDAIVVRADDRVELKFEMSDGEAMHVRLKVENAVRMIGAIRRQIENG
jgi:hypothetical protein